MPMDNPLRNIQLLPGVQTTSENTGGTFVQGCDNSHNYTTVNGVSVYYPMHLLGIFSTFNRLHFHHMTFNKNIDLATTNRIGAEIGMATADTLPKTFGGNADLGLLTAQGSMHFPVGKKAGAIISGRYSNVNLIYDKLINSVLENNYMGYRFHDINATIVYTPTERDVVTADYFQGSDHAEMDVLSYLIHTQLKWDNRAASLRWKRSGDDFSMNNNLYYSAYQSNIAVRQTDSHASIPASIHTIGAKSEQHHTIARGFVTYGGEAMFHAISPQAPHISGSYGEAYTPQLVQKATEGALFFESDIMCGNDLELIGGVRTSAFFHECLRVAIDPKLTLRYQPSNSITWQLTAGTYTQYLHQVGFSNNGLPSEFWVASTKKIPLQRAAKASLALQHKLAGGDYLLSAEPYFTHMVHQVEYKGNALGILTDKYDLNENLIIGNGYNYGIDLMIQKNTGKLTGWIAYAWAKAPRNFVRDEVQISYPSVHNREHDLNVVANYKLDDKWTLSATYVYATGTPYTEVKSGYILGENGIVLYEKHNGSRYPALTRLDMSATYRLPQCRGLEHSVKLAFYNATSAKNPISYTYNRFEGNIIYRRPVYLFSTVIPSISYYMHF